MNDTLIVVPARGNSQGVPRKHARLLGGQPMLWWILDTCQQIKADLVCITENAEISSLANDRGVRVVARPMDLAGPEVPLDPVIHYATEVAEKSHERYQIVATVQATSPFTSRLTIEKAIDLARESETCVTVRDDRGLRWNTSAESVHLSGRAPYRVNRQQMPPCWRETGGVLATQRRFVTPTFRFGHLVKLLPVMGREAVDIDTIEDWWIAERYATQDTTEVRPAA